MTKLYKVNAPVFVALVNTGVLDVRETALLSLAFGVFCSFACICIWPTGHTRMDAGNRNCSQSANQIEINARSSGNKIQTLLSVSSELRS